MLTSSKLFALLAFLLLLAANAASAAAPLEHGSKDEAYEMTNKAVELIEKGGKEAAFAEFDRPNSGYKVKDLYIFVYAMDGYVLYHGGNRALVGKNLLLLKGPDGKLMISEIVNTCKDKGEGWVNYKWFDARLARVLDKSSFVKRIDDICVGAGAYTE